MERLAEVDTIVFDKTGTLTRGAPEVRDLICYNDHFDGRELIGLAAAAESRLQHPVAEALRRRAHELAAPIPICDEPDYTIGMGVEGVVADHFIHIGNRRFMDRSGIIVDIATDDRRRMEEAGFSCLYLAIDGELVALVPYADQIRPESYGCMRRLHALGVKKTIMLTGDNPVVARAVSRQLGIDSFVADMLPGDKADVIRELQRNGRIVAMVGDGINDAPALAQADVGIAMGGGTDAAKATADVTLVRDDLQALTVAMDISAGTMQTIRQNLFFAFAYNTLGIPIAAGLLYPLTGLMLSPMIAAAAMALSSVTVVTNALRLRRTFA